MVNAVGHTGSDTPQAARAGRYLPQPEGYRAFIPAPLRPNPPIQIARDLQRLLSEADRAVGRLDGSVQTLPNPDLFVYIYVRKEAVLSSQIEGTQSSLQISLPPKPTSLVKAGRATSMKWSIT
jgi:Fic family protein